MSQTRAARIASHAPAAALTLGLALALKAFYAGANADELGFVLAPTAKIVEWISGHDFGWESGVGYASPALGIVITSGCAGLNFGIVALCSISFGFADERERAWDRLAWVATAALLAYGATVLANAARIALTALRVAWDVTLGFDPGQIHRIEGIAVYLTGLFLTLAAIESAFASMRGARV